MWAGGAAGCPQAQQGGGVAFARYGRWQCRPDFMNGGGGGEADGCGEVVMEQKGGGGGICWLGSGLHLRSPSPLSQAPSPSH